MKVWLSFFLLTACCIRALPQNGQKNTADCSGAVLINVGKTTVYKARVSPNGAGEKNEIRGNLSNRLFEKEHNTAWHILNILVDGEIAFDIVPEDSTNDYDFALFPYSDHMDCSRIAKGLSKPLRSNLSRGMPGFKGTTGLTPAETNTFVQPGPGNPYSKTLSVKKGEKYLLVLDNVTPGGKSYSIHFKYIPTIDIKGMVVNEEQKGVTATIRLMDGNGNLITSASSTANGEYTITSPVKENEEYKLVFEKDRHFTRAVYVNRQNAHYKNLKTVLPELTAGKNYRLDHIEFYGNSDKLLPKSIPAANELYEMMKKNENMVIRIEGHANNMPAHENNDSEHLMELSGSRAIAIQNFLVGKGIEPHRISTKAFGATRMLVKNPMASDQELSVNRRVEIVIISI